MKHLSFVCLLFIATILISCKSNATTNNSTTTNSSSAITSNSTTNVITTSNSTTITTQPIVNPYTFNDVLLLNDEVKTYEKAEWKIDLSGFNGNPFNPNEIDLIGEFVSPSGNAYVMPTFWYQDYVRSFQSLGNPLTQIANSWAGTTSDYGKIEIINREGVYVGKVSFNAPNGEFKKIGKNVTLSADDANKFTHIRLITAGSGADETVRFEFYNPSGSSYVLVDLNATQLNEQIIPIQFDNGAKLNNSTWMQFYPSGKIVNDFYFQKIELYNPTTLESRVVVDINEEAKNLNPNDPYGKEILSANGKPHFRLRFAPNEVGTWNLKLKVKLNDGKYHEVKNQTFNVNLSDNNNGYIRVEPNRKRSFIFDNGTQYVPIGQNVSWWSSYERKSYDFDLWYGKMAEFDANFSRVWLCDWGLGLFWKNTGIDNYTNRLNNAYRLDAQLDLVEDLGIYLDLVLFHHGQFSTNVNPEWKDNPYNKVNGGPLEKAEDFFVNEEAMEATKQYIRYVIARYGYSTNIFTWELFNEVNFTDNYNTINSKQWHKVMSEYIKEIDPNKHLITSSSDGYDPLYELETIDFVSKHLYTTQNFQSQLKTHSKNFTEKYNKPFLMGEIGIDVNGSQNILDPNGIHIHQALWSGLMSGGAGGGQAWWWDSYIHPQNLYYHFKPISNFASNIDLSLSDLKLLRTEIKFTNDDKLKHYMGYYNDETMYIWFYEINYNYQNQTPIDFIDESFTININNGTYQVKWFNTYTGEFMDENVINVTEGKATINIPNFSKDIAVIIEKM